MTRGRCSATSARAGTRRRTRPTCTSRSSVSTTRSTGGKARRSTPTISSASGFQPFARPLPSNLVRRGGPEPSRLRRNEGSTAAVPTRAEAGPAGLATASVADDDVAAAAAGDVRAFEALYQSAPAPGAQPRPADDGRPRRRRGDAGRLRPRLAEARHVPRRIGVRDLAPSPGGERRHRTLSCRDRRRQRLLRRRASLRHDCRAARSGDLSMDFETAIAELPDGARQIFVLHDVAGIQAPRDCDRCWTFRPGRRRRSCTARA